MDAMGMAEWLRRRALRDPDHPALTFEKLTFSYARLQERVEQTADVLAAQGTKAGDRVAYLGFNHSEFLVAMFATVRLGATFVPLNFRLTGSELSYIVKDSDARILISDPEHTASIEPVRDSLPCEVYIELGTGSEGWVGLDQLRSSAPGHVDEFDVDIDTPAAILYTSCHHPSHPDGRGACRAAGSVPSR